MQQTIARSRVDGISRRDDGYALLLRLAERNCGGLTTALLADIEGILTVDL